MLGRRTLVTLALATCALPGCGGDDSAAYDVVGTLSFETVGCPSDVFAADGRMLLGEMIFDVSDPATPVRVDNQAFFLWPGATPLALRDDQVYLWDAPTLTVVDISTPSSPTMVKRIDLTEMSGGNAVQLVVTDSALVVLRQLINASDLAIFDLAALPDDGVGLVDGWVDLMAVPAYGQGGLSLAARGDLVVITGVPSAIAIDVSTPVSPIVTDTLRVDWFDGSFNQAATWVGFAGDGDVVLRGPGQAEHGPYFAIATLSASGSFGEPIVDELDPAGFQDSARLVNAGDTFMTGTGLYRIDGDAFRFLGTTPDLAAGDGPCGIASDGERFYVAVVNRGLEIVEVP